MSALTLTVHRATQEIGGNCIELAVGDARIILDVGRPLAAARGAIGLLPQTLDLRSPVLGVLISHPHQDHFGLLNEIPADWLVWCGEPTAHLMRLTVGLTGGDIRQPIRTWTTGATFEIGPFRVTPILTDHSAFDAHMLLIEAAGRRVLYSGDFRTHGRKASLVERLIARPPERLNALLMEGTNLGSDKPTQSEAALEDEFIDVFRQTAGRVFVAWSAQNIDRRVTLYRAALKSGRTLAVDLYTAEVLDLVSGYGSLPQPGWRGLKVVMTRAFARLYRSKGRGEFVERMAGHGVSAAALTKRPEQWAVMVRPSLLRDFEAKGVLPTPDDAWCWSQWRGYLEQDDGRRLRAWFEAGGAKARPIHTSGHASAQELRRFARAMRPERLIPIHGVSWDAEGETDGFPQITRLRDGERFELP